MDSSIETAPRHCLPAVLSEFHLAAAVTKAWIERDGHLSGTGRIPDTGD
jgi:hypothetical protein